MKISIIHPSRGRAEIAKSVRDKWMQSADYSRSEIEYLLVVDNTDPELKSYDRVFNGDFLVGDHKSAIHAINEGAKTCDGEIIIVVSDDFDCPEHWDTLLIDALEGKEDFCVKTKDGIQPTLMTLPIMDRKYYERFGYIYHPDYLHMYSDQEMTAVAHMLGRNLTLDITFPHLHYSTGKFAKDDISVKNDKTYPQGKEVFQRRLRDNFGITNPVKSYSSIKWH